MQARIRIERAKMDKTTIALEAISKETVDLVCSSDPILLPEDLTKKPVQDS